MDKLEVILIGAVGLTVAFAFGFVVYYGWAASKCLEKGYPTVRIDYKMQVYCTNQLKAESL